VAADVLALLDEIHRMVWTMGSSAPANTAPAYTVFLVMSASHAIKGEKALAKAGVASKLIPVPRSLSSQCGVCLRVSFMDREQAGLALAEAGVQVTGSHDLPGDEFRPPSDRRRADSNTRRKKEKRKGGAR